MTASNTSDLFVPVQTLLAEKIQGKKEVTNEEYNRLQWLRFLIVGGNATFNACYGYSLGVSTASMILLALTFFSGDFALAYLHQFTTTKTSFIVISLIAKLGLILLSVMAGTSFYLSQRHEHQLSSSNVAGLERQIETNRILFERYGNSKTGDRLEALNNRLEVERKRSGANYSSVNALPFYLSQYFNVSFQIMNFLISMTWTLVLLITGLALSSVSSMLWTPDKEESFIKGELAKQKLRVSLLKQKLPSQSIVKPLAIPYGGSESSPKKERSPTRDTGTDGDIADRYHRVSEQVKQGQIKPQVSALKSLGMAAETAQRYLKQMADDGILNRKGKRYQLAG